MTEQHENAIKNPASRIPLWCWLMLGAVVSVGSLASLDYIIPGRENSPWWEYFLHHLFAALAVAFSVGILVEQLARKDMFRLIVETLINNERVVGMIAHSRRSEWMRTLLVAQLSLNPAELSNTIFTNIIEPCMMRRRYRTNFDYKIKFKSLDAIEALNTRGLSGPAYAYLEISCRFCQHLPERLDRVNIAAIFAPFSNELADNPSTQLDIAFKDEHSSSCIYRDTIFIQPGELERISDFLREHYGPGKPEDVALVRVKLEIDGNSGWQPVKVAATEFEPESRIVRFWFDVPKEISDPLELNIHLKMAFPYLVRAGHYPVLFGEPNGSPSINFIPPPNVNAGNVHLVRVIQDNSAPDSESKPNPQIVRGGNSIQINVPRVDGKPCWLLPTSGVIFVWGGSPAAHAGVPDAPGTSPPPARHEPTPGRPRQDTHSGRRHGRH